MGGIVWLSLSTTLPPSLGEGVFLVPNAGSDTSEVTTPSSNCSETFTCAVIWHVPHTPSYFSYWISDLPSLLLLLSLFVIIIIS